MLYILWFGRFDSVKDLEGIETIVMDRLNDLVERLQDVDIRHMDKETQLLLTV